MKNAFTCGHCGAMVPRLQVPGLKGGLSRNSCPACNWSKHTWLGANVGYPPCGAMMRPCVIDDGLRVTWRCLGCGFMMTCASEKGTDELAAGKHPDGITMTYYPPGGPPASGQMIYEHFFG